MGMRRRYADPHWMWWQWIGAWEPKLLPVLPPIFHAGMPHCHHDPAYHGCGLPRSASSTSLTLSCHYLPWPLKGLVMLRSLMAPINLTTFSTNNDALVYRCSLSTLTKGAVQRLISLFTNWEDMWRLRLATILKSRSLLTAWVGNIHEFSRNLHHGISS